MHRLQGRTLRLACLKKFTGHVLQASAGPASQCLCLIWQRQVLSRAPRRHLEITSDAGVFSHIRMLTPSQAMSRPPSEHVPAMMLAVPMPWPDAKVTEQSFASSLV